MHNASLREGTGLEIAGGVNYKLNWGGVNQGKIATPYPPARGRQLAIWPDQGV